MAREREIRITAVNYRKTGADVQRHTRKEGEKKEKKEERVTGVLQ